MVETDGEVVYAIISKTETLCGLLVSTQDSNVKLFPNPSNGIVNFEFTNTLNAKITVFDITGKVLLRKKFTQSKEQLDLSAYKGFLLLKVDNGETLVTKSIFIK